MLELGQIMIENPQQKMERDVKQFLDVYQSISPEAKAHFEAQMHSALGKFDEKTRVLYFALLQAAKDGDDVITALAKMKKEADLNQAKEEAAFLMNLSSD